MHYRYKGALGFAKAMAEQPVISHQPKPDNDIGKQHRQDHAIFPGNALDAKQNEGSADRQGLLGELADTAFGAFEPAIPDSHKQYSSANSGNIIMVEGFGALPVVPEKYVAANDNFEGAPLYGKTGGLVGGNHTPAAGWFDTINKRGQYIGLRREERGPFIQIYPARKFHPFDPKPEEIFIESIAHGLSNICRYSGAGEKHYSVAEHCTLIARYLAAKHAPEVALAGLLHDAPECLSGFGDVGRPVKGKAPIIGETEDNIYRKAVAPRFGLSLDIPAEVHEADTRIIADEIAANLAPMEWQGQYDDPLGVRIRCWSPKQAEVEFLATFDALTGGEGKRA